MSQLVGRTRLYQWNPRNPLVPPFRALLEVALDSLPGAEHGAEGLGVRLDRGKLAEYHELFRRLGTYPYDQDPLRPGWTPLVPNDRWADPKDDRVPEVPL